jgi:trehalose utilization protein
VSMAAPRVTVWNEFRHERVNPAVQKIYPEGIHQVLSGALAERGLEVATATLDEPEHGLSEARLAATDVLVWWGHKAHDEVEDGIVARVQERVLGGMGLIVLHSGHFSKIFRRLMGTTCTVNWRAEGERERIWVVKPEHPIAQGLPPQLVLEREEMYGEVFGIPDPDELVFLSWFKGGEVFRSGCCWTRGKGRVFYWRPGHETFPSYHEPHVLQVIANACRWAAPLAGAGEPSRNIRCEPHEPL